MKYLIGKNIDSEKLDNLWNSIGWKPRGEQKWKEVLSKSSFVYSAWDNENLVGLGRILEDGVMCMFYDIGVNPDYHRRGIGTHIVEMLIEQVQEKEYRSIGLFFDEKNLGNVEFYERLGFEKVSTGMELVKFMKRE